MVTIHILERTVRVLALTVLAALVLAAPALAGSTSPSRIDEEQDCLEPVPESVSQAGVTDDGREVVIDVLVLLDSIDLEYGRGVMETAARAYAPLNVKLDVRYEQVDFEPERVEGGSEITSYRKMIEDARAYTGGARPGGVDVVYTMTRKVMDALGFADCIGGVRYGERAFAVGRDSGAFSVGPVNFYVDVSAKTAAHEIGHLMGAHHHYANCVEGAEAEDVENVEPATCTLMFNHVDTMSLRFSTLEALAVRGHAVDFADDTPSEQPVTPRTLEFRLKKHLIATGRVDAGAARHCAGEATVQLQQSTAAGWELLTELTTEDDGTFELRIHDRPGTYRAFVAATEFVGERGMETCGEVSSPAVRHRH